MGKGISENKGALIMIETLSSETSTIHASDHFKRESVLRTDQLYKDAEENWLDF